jgi:hypothetical protein
VGRTNICIYFFLDKSSHTWHLPPVIVHLLQFGMFLKVGIASFCLNSKFIQPIPVDTKTVYLYLEASFAAGLGTPIRRGLSNISLLRWSPSGDYLLAAKLYGQFSFHFDISSYYYFQIFTNSLIY